MTPLNPDEALYAFVDGELELGDEQRLFDALASHPELRTEMKDVLAIRNAVHRDVLFPPASAETEILAATGLVAPVGVGAVAVAASPTLLSRFLHTGGGILAGVIIAYFLFNTEDSSIVNGSDTKSGNAQAGLGQGAQSTQLSDVQTGATPPPVAAAPVRVETLYVRVKDKAPKSVTSIADNGNEAANAEQTNPNITNAAPNGGDFSGIASLRITTAPSLYMSSSSSLAPGGLFRDTRWSEASPLMAGVVDAPYSIRMRSLPSSVGSDRRIPQSVNDAVLANAAVAFLYPVMHDVRVGAEVGFEAYHQVFTTLRDGRPVEVDQTPVLAWFGGTAEWAPSEFDLLLTGLRPFASLTGGYALAQGPMGNIVVGLQYQPLGPLRMSAGYSYGMLGFRDTGNWFVSKKYGFTYALSVDL